MRKLFWCIWQMARKLQNALAQASYKARNGAENLSMNDQSGARKRRRSDTTISPVSSSSSEPQLFNHPYGSSPIKAPGSTYTTYKAHVNPAPHQRNMNHPRFTYPSPRKRFIQHIDVTLPTVEISRTSWKSKHKLPESSPASHRHHVHFPRSQDANNASFLSETSPVPESPPIGHVSDEDLSISQNSYNRDSYSFNASGPRTPPPTRTRSNRHRKSNATAEEACFLDLANSPSPANLMYPPSTPPSNSTFLGNSMISTPRGGGYAAPITPGPPLNFSEFLNMTPTPSPAQGAFGNYTPGLPNTPLAAKDARKKLHDSGLAPGEGSPMVGVSGLRSMKKGTGLGMDLGGELLPHWMTLEESFLPRWRYLLEDDDSDSILSELVIPIYDFTFYTGHRRSTIISQFSRHHSVGRIISLCWIHPVQEALKRGMDNCIWLGALDASIMYFLFISRYVNSQGKAVLALGSVALCRYEIHIISSYFSLLFRIILQSIVQDFNHSTSPGRNTGCRE